MNTVSEREKLKFFITEITPNFRDKSSLFLYGKALIRNEFVSAVVKIDNIMREIYVVP